jgi:hypothetical protein
MSVNNIKMCNVAQQCLFLGGRIYFAGNNKTHLGLCSIFKQIWGFLTHYFVNVHIIKFHGNSSNGSRADNMRTDRLTDGRS